MSAIRSSFPPTDRPGDRALQLLVDLANLRGDSLEAFRSWWGHIYGRYDDRELFGLRDELRVLWDQLNTPPEDLGETRDQTLSPRAQELQEKLTLHILAGPTDVTSLEQYICQEWLRREKDNCIVIWRSRERRIKPNPRCLPATLAWTCVHQSDRLGVCRNPDCPARYFVAQHRKQIYCSADCARPAKRAAARKWWRTHRGKGRARERGSGKSR